MRDCLAEMGKASTKARRATPADALDLATATHMAGRRVDMGTLARELGVGRATLYRWYDSREALLEQVLLGRVEAYVEAARSSSHGRGDERLMEIVRAMIAASQEARPVRLFIEREPTLALRILAGEHGRLHRFLVDQALIDLASSRGGPLPAALQARVDATLQLITALLWVAIAIGDEPPVERIEGLARELLAEVPARRRGGKR